MNAAALVVAGMLAQIGIPGSIIGDPVTIPPGPLSITWNSSVRSGSGKLAQQSPTEWTIRPNESQEDWIMLHYAPITDGVGQLELLLNTPRTVAFGTNYWSLDTAQASPFKLVYSIIKAEATGWGNDLVVTITQP